MCDAQRARFSDVLDRFPAVQHAFAYGSAVFHQPGLYANQAPKPMFDFIFAVQDPVAWHAEVRPVPAAAAPSLLLLTPPLALFSM
jgi:hypothetical protein